MAKIVLRNGKTIVYNETESMDVIGGVIRLSDKQEFLIALIPIDTIERAEFEEPCKIYRVAKKKRKLERAI